MLGPQIPVKKGVPYEMDADDTSTFEQWKARINRLTVRFVGVTVDDLPDCPYYEWYRERVRPTHAANQALEGLLD